MTIFLSALFKNSLLVQAQIRAKQPSFVTIKISFSRKCIIETKAIIIMTLNQMLH
ncbi:MAG: hypothetical protein V3U57_06545 [Robiginitomaculum sp.]